MRYAVIDVETTGLSPAADRVVEMACVLIEDGAIARTWSTLVNPQRPIPEYATRVHGITDADVAGAPPFMRAQLRLFNFCHDAIVVAHNASFDLRFLPMLAPLQSLCTLQLARRFFPNAPNHKNQTLREYLAIDDLLETLQPTCHAEHVEALPAHRALADALVTAGILLRCLEKGQQPYPVRKTA